MKQIGIMHWKNEVIIAISTSGLLWWFDEANQVKKFKTLWSYV